MGDRLVLPDGAVEDHAFVGVLRRQLQCRLPDADAFEAHDDALGVQPVDEYLKPWPT